MIVKKIKKTIKDLGIGKNADPGEPKFPPDFDSQEIAIIRKVKPYTMTNVERIFALIQSVRYLLNANISGSIVECGVWRGGSMMAVAYAILQSGKPKRDLYLFDTFEGMTKPSHLDISCLRESATDLFVQLKRTEQSSEWCYAPLEEVQRNLFSTGYPQDNLRFIKGRVEDKLPSLAPETIALLRLDTDWYESTRHELIHLYPRLSPGGVLIIDDYGYWEGAQKATDEYLSQNNINLLLHRIDSAGRIAIKP